MHKNAPNCQGCLRAVKLEGSRVTGQLKRRLRRLIRNIRDEAFDLAAPLCSGHTVADGTHVRTRAIETLLLDREPEVKM